MSETNNETAVRSRATSTTSPSKAKLTPLVPGKEDPNRPLVELTHVEKHFGALHVLKDINLTVAKGEVLVVVGPSGSGKSTMCRTINRLETIDSGDIRIDGKPLPQEGKELANLRAEVGMVFQSFNLFANKTILESLRTAFPQAQFRELASLVKDGHFDPVPEQEALLKADVIVLQFPFNWYSVPGLLKTWIDEVLLHGFAYGSGAKLSGKTVLLSITAGAPEAAYQRDGFTGHTVFELLTPLAVTAKACSMIFAEPVVSYGYSVPAAQNDKENYLANARKHAQALSAQLKAL